LTTVVIYLFSVMGHYTCSCDAKLDGDFVVCFE